ncbi:uncharacterized protein LOC110459368 [Mizuhopecten yessoensis]|nr:uncharacterized protein LOC110459368 [Mizuhopecten yessoensis]
MRTAAIVMFIGAMIFTWITTETRKAKKPFCIVFMVIFTMIIGYCIMMLSCVVGSPIPLICVGIIAIVCILTILFLLQKWITFTLISGMLFTVVVVPSLMGISTAIFNPVMDCVNGGIAALIFSWWVMLITWCMVEDRKKNGLQPDQYLAIQPFVFAGVLFLPWILLGIIFCKFEWKKYK